MFLHILFHQADRAVLVLFFQSRRLLVGTCDPSRHVIEKLRRIGTVVGTDAEVFHEIFFHRQAVFFHEEQVLVADFLRHLQDLMTADLLCRQHFCL